MPTPLDGVEAEAPQLSPKDRVARVDQAWAEEIERRVAEVEAGRMPLVPAADAIARVRPALG